MFARPFSLIVVAALIGATTACAPRPSSAVDPVVRERLAPPSATAMSWFLRARAAEARGDHEEAERSLQWLVRKDGQRAVTHEHLAAFYARSRRWDEARQAWMEALERDPDRWQPHAGLATLDKRAGDAASEKLHLQAAVDRSADAETHERLVAIQVADGSDEAARGTYRRWNQITLDDPVLLMRRARAGRRLGVHDLALDDLIIAADAPGRSQDAAELIVESAHASCRLRTAWVWARTAPVDEPRVRRAVLELAAEVGDAALVEQRLRQTSEPVPAAAHQTRTEGVPVGVDAPELLAAELWRRAARPERAIALAEAQQDPWARIVEALAALSVLDPERARASLARVPDDHIAEGWRLTLSLGLGDLPAEALQTWVDAHPDHVGQVARAAAELHALPGVDAGVVQVRGLRLHAGSVPAPDGVVRLPGTPAEVLERVVARKAIARVLASGRGAEARHLAETWTQRRPNDPHAWVARAEADAEHADTWLARALELEPCHAEALLLSARHAPVDEQVGWLRRAQEAAPLSKRVHQALSRRGLGAR